MGDLVLTTPFSFVASANSILYERGIPIFVDVDPTTGNIDPTLVAEAAETLAAGGDRGDVDRWLPGVTGAWRSRLGDRHRTAHLPTRVQR